MKDQKVNETMQIYFLQPVLIIFTRGAINSEHDCNYSTLTWRIV